MKFFKKLLGKSGINNIDSIGKISSPLDENLYWSIIGGALKRSKGQDEQEEYLVSRISKCSLIEIIGFQLRTDKLLFDLYNPSTWCAAYILNGGCSDDSFHYFRAWVISRGREVYYDTLKNPDSLVSEYNEDGEYDFEMFLSIASEIFMDKTDRELYDYVDDSLAFTESKHPTIEFTWNESDPESMRPICPNLFEKVWLNNF
jgi:hypothetical protein